MSARGPASSPRACSGARYAAVPSTEPTWVMLDCSVARAIPKSASLTTSASETSRLPGLHVAVHDAVAVGVVEPAAGLGDDLDGLVDVEVAAVAQQLGARVPGDVLHHDEVLVLALVEAEVEHLDDVRMHQARGGERLAPEARDERRVVGEVLGEQLQRDVALEPLVEGEVHGRHAADAEPALDPVAPCDCLTVSRCHCRSRCRCPPPGRPSAAADRRR